MEAGWDGRRDWGLKRRRYVPTATLAWFCIGAQRVSDEHQPCEASASTRPVTATPLSSWVQSSNIRRHRGPFSGCGRAWVLAGGGGGLWDYGKWSVMGGGCGRMARWAGRSKGVQLQPRKEVCILRCKYIDQCEGKAQGHGLYHGECSTPPLNFHLSHPQYPGSFLVSHFLGSLRYACSRSWSFGDI